MSIHIDMRIANARFANAIARLAVRRPSEEELLEVPLGLLIYEISYGYYDIYVRDIKFHPEIRFRIRI